MTELQLREFEQALVSMDRAGADRILTAAQGMQRPSELVEKLVVPALEWLGTEWEAGRLALSQIYMGGRICEELVDRILPPAISQRKDQPKMAIVVLEDYHLLGKRIVYSSLRAAGFELLDFGRMEVDRLIHRTIAEQVRVLLISTLMINSALRVKEVRAGFVSAAVPVKIVVGGAPFRFDDQLWREVGADATSDTAAGAVAVINQLAEDLK